ncbi:unnamed protein product [Aphanomyces euteiches]|uniref:V-type proton ATPase subunit S1/VOA1 transmembrane domain-containing protein n=1 Tax=Aphanomyces euteiches TaxID=100861 RepID=A0A6G0XQ83_9STRA|nr:hypothetical protein Ae201684_002466 [Aphanomyces euteiches]KAH9093254.1 hypothetical protein Ae201684P_008913 [Aphanomyces euteiches]KAH9154841.1 hypothetical protein AeRB84_003135 [Aphanomyces euteiches]
MRCASVLAFLATSVAAVVENAYVPLMLWANSGVLEHPANDFAGNLANGEYSVSHISNTLAFLQDNGDNVKDSMNAHTPFEVFYPRAHALVLFVRDTLRLDEMEHFQDTPVENIYRNASSSVVYPHTIRSNGDSLVSALHPSHSIDIEGVKGLLQRTPSLGENDKTDLIVVKISNDLSFSDAAELIRTSVALFDHAAYNRVIYGLTGNKATKTSDEFEGFHRALLNAAAVVTPLVCPPGSYLSTAQAEPFCFTHYVNMTPTILSGLVLSLFFLLCVYIGLYALDSIQTPLKYPSIAPPKGKEY